MIFLLSLVSIWQDNIIALSDIVGELASYLSCIDSVVICPRILMP